MEMIQHPWQSGPTELIKYGLEHLHRPSEFDQRIAFLLLDVGIETLFKTYLTLPDDVTNAKTKYYDRKKAAEGNFHELVKGIKDAAPSSLNGINISYVQFYHDLRNKLYHEGNGITVPSKHAAGYARLAVELLKALLDVELTQVLMAPEIEAERQKEQAQLQRKLDRQVELVHKSIRDLKAEVELAIEIIEPNLLLPTFIRKLDTIASPSSKDRIYQFKQLIEHNIKNEGVKRSFLNSADSKYFDNTLTDFWGDIHRFYLTVLKKWLPESTNGSGQYFVAKLYPEYAQQPTPIYDENDEFIYVERELEDVIEEGRSLVTEIEKTIGLIHDWVEKPM